MKSLFNYLTRKGQLGALLVALVCIIIVMGSIFGGLSSGNYELGTDLVQVLKDDESTEKFNFFNMAIIIPIILIVIAVLALLVFGIKSVVSDPKGSLKFVIGAGLVIVLFGLFYSISASDTEGASKLVDLVQKNNIGEGTSKMISGGIKTTIVLIVLSALSAVAGEIYNLFK